MWNAFVHANFYSDVKKYIENMNWMRIANLDEKCYSLMLVNKFYSGLLLRFDKYENLPRFNLEVLYSFIDGHERMITEFDLGKLISCEFYKDVFEALDIIKLIMFGTLWLEILIVRKWRLT